jgi:hypothetical protein
VLLIVGIEGVCLRRNLLETCRVVEFDNDLKEQDCQLLYTHEYDPRIYIYLKPPLLMSVKLTNTRLASSVHPSCCNV